MSPDAPRVIARAVFDEHDIRAWYKSPYPIDTRDLVDAKLWVCARCFKYTTHSASLQAHLRTCPLKHPPGRKLYQRGAHIIWEVDGASEPLYAQNMCLFGKLFIDNKTICFDVEPFRFYILTDASSQLDHVLGFFSKEKISYDGFNLACIVVFPPYQRQGYGSLLMEFSYYLSDTEHVIGTPERPLSALGLRAYLAFWRALLVRTLHGAYTQDSMQARRARAVLGGERMHIARVPCSELDAKKRRSHLGWAGEAPRRLSALLSMPETPMPAVTSLADLSYAAGLRVEDATLALAHADLLHRAKENDFVLDARILQDAARRYAQKPALLDLAYLV
ncbi:histone acetyltransferase [Malassezia vespertilionis]|uniref:histone acetyltransferase n=1 Tax=Malassezia vespertilionis TaxID=2020962 RepID=A0A2N1JFJ9_9BASI|nr:histone acetyltransferase [Malassezia vespertilionis]PKI85318.1 hypothetical protein MVES_001172 [Malassezia vespertilionis]WFD05911.1 histone acetyltransferase [Malassezia vespertilionis]